MFLGMSCVSSSPLEISLYRPHRPPPSEAEISIVLVLPPIRFPSAHLGVIRLIPLFHREIVRVNMQAQDVLSISLITL